MENEKINKLLIEINEKYKTYNYVQIANILQDLNDSELDELEETSMFLSSSDIYEKIKKANRFIKSKRTKSQNQSTSSINDIISKFDSVPIEQLIYIKEYLKNKKQLNQSEINFLTMLNNKINERSSKRI